MATYSLVCETCGKSFVACRAWHQTVPRFCSNGCKFRRYGDTPAAVLAARVDRNGGPDACWPFVGPLATNGYGLIRIHRKQLLAHRVAWEVANGPIPDGLLVCHKCDNPPCCNPSHYFLGTPADNSADAAAKGRQPRGNVHSQAKLTERDIPVIRALRGTMTVAAIAERFGVDRTTIYDVWNGKNWSHVP